MKIDYKIKDADSAVLKLMETCLKHASTDDEKISIYNTGEMALQQPTLKQTCRHMIHVLQTHRDMTQTLFTFGR